MAVKPSPLHALARAVLASTSLVEAHAAAQAVLSAPPPAGKSQTDAQFLTAAMAFRAAYWPAVAAAQAEGGLGWVNEPGIGRRGITPAAWGNWITYRGTRVKGVRNEHAAIPEARFWPDGVWPAGLEVYPVAPVAPEPVTGNRGDRIHWNSPGYQSRGELLSHGITP
jgi:hypothetical protein